MQYYKSYLEFCKYHWPGFAGAGFATGSIYGLFSKRKCDSTVERCWRFGLEGSFVFLGAGLTLPFSIPIAVVYAHHRIVNIDDESRI